MIRVHCALLVVVYFFVAFYFLYASVPDLLSKKPSKPNEAKKQIILWLMLPFLWPLLLLIAIIDSLLDRGIE